MSTIETPPLSRTAVGVRPPQSIVESCHSIWLFDNENHRFRRFLKGLRTDRIVSTDWRSYDHLTFDARSDAFLVFLDGIGVYNSPTDYRAVHHLQLSKFDGTTLIPIGRPSLLDDHS